MKKILHLLLLMSIVLISCKSAQKLYDQGRYEDAVEKAAKQLNKKPTDKKLQALVLDAYDFALNDRLDEIDRLENGFDENKWEAIYKEYQVLNKMYQSIKKYRNVFDLVKPLDYSEEMQEVAQLAGQSRLERGLRLLNSFDKKDIRNAYYEFKNALVYLPNDAELIRLREQAYQRALLNVAFVPIHENNNIDFADYRKAYRNFDEEVLRNIKNKKNNSFVNFYSITDLNNLNVPADFIVEINFDQMNIGSLEEKKSTRTVEKRVVVKEIVYKEDSVIKEYANVQARITTSNKLYKSNGQITVSVFDNNNQFLWSDYFQSEHNWQTQYTSFAGDERALSDADKKELTLREEKGPSKDEVLAIIVKDLQAKVENGLVYYFNRQ